MQLNRPKLPSPTFLKHSPCATIDRASLPRGHTGRRGCTDMARGYTGGSLKRQTQHEISNSPHALCRTSVWRQSLVPKRQATTQRQLPPREIVPSSSSPSIYCWHLSSVLWKMLRFICNYRRVICPLPCQSRWPNHPALKSGMSACDFVEALLPFAAQSTSGYRCTKCERRETHESVSRFRCCSRASVAGSLFVQPALMPRAVSVGVL